MFTSEDDALTLINNSVDRYEKHFDLEFPLYEYIHITKNDQYDFSLKGAERFSLFIDDCIKSNLPVKIPSDYHDRLY